jgi:hypothetical protein
MGLQVTDRYYEHIPGKVINISDTTIMWDVLVITDRTILANLPDIILHVKKEKPRLLMDIAIPAVPNVNTKETEKNKQVIRLVEIDVSRMWK